jgi:preprotein translocase subunit SecD
LLVVLSLAGGACGNGDGDSTPSTTTAPVAPISLEIGPVLALEPEPCDDGVGTPGVGRTAGCYAIGDPFLTGEDVESAQAVLDEVNGWVVNFSVTDAALPGFHAAMQEDYVNAQVAIVVDGVVVSAPTVVPGFTGREVQIAGEFDEGEARALASGLNGS